MEKQVRVKEQYPLKERTFKDSRGDDRVLSSVELVLSDGVDTFVGEVLDDLAKTIDKTPLDKSWLYGVQCRMSVREWDSKQTNQKQRANSIRVLSINGV